MTSTPEWRKELELVNDLMREVSRQTDPQELVRIYAEGVHRLRGSDRLISLSRRGLEAPWYRVTRDSRNAEQIDPWRERDRLPLLREGFLGELLYSEQPLVIMDLKVPASDPTHSYFEGMAALYTLPHWDNGVALNMTLRMFADASRLDVAQYPNILWQSNLFGRTTANLVLRRELREAYDALDREMKIVGDIQRSLLPMNLPSIQGLELAASYQTSRQAGGDYYDLFPLRDGAWGIFIADVSGHGTPAAVLMAVTHALAHAYPGQAAPPGAVMAHLNGLLSKFYTWGSGSFVTAFYGVYHPGDKTLTYARAGHNPPRLQSKGVVTALDGVGDVPLGVLAEASFEEATVRLSAGDTILFYTDGITEAMNDANEQFGEERLDALVASRRESAAALIESVLAEVRAFEGVRMAADDRTLLAAFVR
ncbi:MAG: serine/threonine-protein phosphatase [Planctomycetes bacterium]|nr:serine/threonine-protein phosphatase [Planctomycetota bacterium]